MKGNNLIIDILKYSAVGIGIVLAILGYYNSWSEHVVDAQYRPILNFILMSIMWVFILMSVQAKDRRKELTKWFGFSIRLGAMFRVTAFFFGMIVLCELDNYTKIFNLVTFDLLHYIMTGLAIGSGYFTMLAYPDDKKSRRWTYVGLLFGAIGFGLGFLFHLYSISWAEVLVSIPLLVFVSLLKRINLKWR